jgi:hypothetical protein
MIDSPFFVCFSGSVHMPFIGCSTMAVSTQAQQLAHKGQCHEFLFFICNVNLEKGKEYSPHAYVDKPLGKISKMDQ